MVQRNIKPMRMDGEFNGANISSLESEGAPTRPVHLRSLLPSRKNREDTDGLQPRGLLLAQGGGVYAARRGDHRRRGAGVFLPLRDAWISAANRNEMLDALNARVPAVPALETQSIAPH